MPRNIESIFEPDDTVRLFAHLSALVSRSKQKEIEISDRSTQDIYSMQEARKVKEKWYCISSILRDCQEKVAQIK